MEKKITAVAPSGSDPDCMDSQQPRNTKWVFRWRYSVMLFIAVVAAADWPILSGKGFEIWDAYDLGTPYFCLIADFLHAYQLLLWNPWSNGGSPDFADAGSGVFSPILLGFAWFGGDPATYRLYWLFIWAVGGVGMLFLARHLRAPVWGGLVVALGYYFSGYYTGHAEHTSVVYTFSFLPLIIWRFDAALQRRRLWCAVEAGALWGLSALGGYPLLVVLSGAFVGVWAVGRWGFAESRNPGVLVRNIAFGAVVCVVGCVVVMPSYFSFLYECAGFTGRSHAVSLEVVLENSLNPGALATFASPYLPNLKLLPNGSFWSGTDVSSCSIYLGGVTFVLAFLSLLTRKEAGWRWFLLCLGLLALGCALAHVLPFRTWLYDLVPPMRFFRHPSMFRGYFLFCLCLLAIAGAGDLDRFLRTDQGLSILKKFFAVAVVSGILGVTVFLGVMDSVNSQGPEAVFATVHNHFVWLGICVIGLVALAYRRKFRAQKWMPAAFIGLAMVDGLWTMHLSSPTIYTTVPPPDFSKFHVPSVDLGAAAFDRRYALPNYFGGYIQNRNFNLFLKVPTLNGYTPLSNQFLLGTVSSRLALTALGADRVWFAENAPEVSWTDESFAIFKAKADGGPAPIIVRHAQAEVLGSAVAPILDPLAFESATLALRLTPEVVAYEPNRLVLRVNCPADGWVMVTDRWSRTWKATVNQSAVPVWCANFIFRAVQVKQGASEIAFEFAPKWLWILLPMSWCTLVAVLFGSVFTNLSITGKARAAAAAADAS